MHAVHTRIADELPRLRRYARALMKDPDRADDLVQETVVRALSKAHLWKPDTDLRAWLFTLMHNQYVNAIRSAVRRGSHSSLDAALEIGRPGNQTEHLELRDFRAALDRLPAEQREVVLLIGLEGLKYEEVAEITGVPVGTVRSRLSRARETLREMMDAPDRGGRVRTPAEADAGRRAARAAPAAPEGAAGFL
jgi:RNA polymerase sigma-70 factor (ECF subfamily)